MKYDLVLWGLLGVGLTVCTVTWWPRHHEPYVLLVCGQEPNDATNTYHDCTSHPLSVESEDQCTRSAAAAAWVLQTGPAVRAMLPGKLIVIQCMELSNIAGAHTEPAEPHGLRSL